MDDKNTAQNPLMPVVHSDMDVPPPPFGSTPPPATSTPPPPSFTPPVVHEEVVETPEPTPAPMSPSPTPEPPVTHPPIHDDAPVGPFDKSNSGGNFGGLPPVISQPQKNNKGKIFAAIAAVVLLLVSIPLGIILVKQSQEVREKAFEGGACSEEGDIVRECTSPNECRYRVYRCNGSFWEDTGSEEVDCSDGEGGGVKGCVPGSDSQGAYIVQECFKEECDTGTGHMMCVDMWRYPDGHEESYAGRDLGERPECQPGGGAPVDTPTPAPAEPTAPPATQAPAPANDECTNEGGSCVGSSGVCANQGGYTSDASCSNGGACCMGAAGSPSAPTDAPAQPTAPGTGAPGSGAPGSGSCAPQITFGNSQAITESSPAFDCSTRASVGISMTITVPAGCSPQTVTWKEYKPECPGQAMGQCGGTCAGTAIDPIPAVVSAGSPKTVNISCTVPNACGACQVDYDTISAAPGLSHGAKAVTTSGCGPMACTQNIVVYKYPYNIGNKIDKSAIRPGDDLKFCLPNATSGTPMITINNGTPKVANENGAGAGEKCYQFDVPDDATSLKVTGAL
ncbi:MAG: hypothetical protein Q7S79_01195 [bacterium]|nr:hypothetical protein [bacterium]